MAGTWLPNLERSDPALMVWFAAGVLVAILPAFDGRRLVVTAALVIASVYGLVRRRFLLPRILIHLGFSAALLLGLLSAARSAVPSWSLLGVAYLGLCAFAITALAHAWHGSQKLYARLIALGFVLPVILLCLVAALIIYSSLLSGLPLVYPEPLRNFANIRFFNQYQTWLLPFLPAALALACPLPRVRPLFYQSLVVVCAVFFWALFWRSSGRGTGYATLLASLAVATLLGRPGRVHAGRMIGLAVAGFGIHWLMFGIGTNARMASTESPGRWYLWQLAAERVGEHPVFGIGPMMYAAIDNGVASHPHNAPLQWAAEWGLPAATLLVALVAWLLCIWMVAARRLVREPNPVAPALTTAITASLLAGTFHAMISGVVVMPASQFMLVTVASLAAGIGSSVPTNKKKRVRPPRSNMRQVAFSISLLASVVYVCGFVAHDYLKRGQEKPTKNSAYLRNTYQPRFWDDGTLTSVVEDAR